jgi:hypothetical protein
MQLPSTLKELREFAKTLGIKGVGKFDHFNLLSKVMFRLEQLNQEKDD